MPEPARRIRRPKAELEAVPPKKCAARSKRTGLQCRAWAVPGSNVCRAHGGAARQVRAAAERRIEQVRLKAEAADTLDRLGVSIDVTPIEALEAMHGEAAGTVAVLRHLVGQLPRSEWYADVYHSNGSPTGRAVPHVLLVMWGEAQDRLAKLAEACAKLGLDERRTRLMEAQVDRLLTAVTAAIADVGLTGEQTARFKQALADRLRTP